VRIAARLAAIALGIALAASARADAPRLRPWTRGPAPALAGDGLAGGRIDLSALRGRVVLVQFWASWCEPCDAELAGLVKLRERLRGRPFELVTVNLGEGPERARQYLREHALKLPVLLDRDQRAARAFGVGGLPMAFLVNARGDVESWVFGESSWSEGELAAALERLLRDAEGASASR
jgi:thiol-disulfide isomerase/thioredoxin